MTLVLDRTELPAVAAIEAFFFTAMNTVGWASPTPQVGPHELLTGWKQISYKEVVAECQLGFTDEWCATGGRTTIRAHFGQMGSSLLWCMQYRGSYPELAMTVVKRSLRKAYGNRDFFGGRGPDWFTDPDRDHLIYHNQHSNSGFTEFRGVEQVIQANLRYGTLVGQHTYWGGMLL